MTIKCGFLEIYNEQILDLLNPQNSSLRVRETMGGTIYVQARAQMRPTARAATVA